MNYSKKSTTIKGEIATLLIVGLAIVAGTFFGAKWFSRTAGDRDKTPIAQVDNAKIEAEKKKIEQREKIDKEKDAQLKTGQGASLATGVAISAAQNTASQGQIPVKELKTAKTLNDTANTALEQAIGPLDPRQIEDLKKLVENLNSDVTELKTQGVTALAKMNSDLQTSVERERKAQDDLKNISAEYQTKIDGLQKKADQWALERDVIASKWDKMMFWVWVAAGIYGFSIIAPWMAKVFPALSPIAGAVGTVVAPSIQYLKNKVEDRAHDLVALVDANKKFVEEIDPSKVDAFKAHVQEWWEKDLKGMADVEAIKQKLRL